MSGACRELPVREFERTRSYYIERLDMLIDMKYEIIRWIIIYGLK